MRQTEAIDHAAFESLGPAWNDLIASSTAPLPFLTHQWLTLWWSHFGQGQEFVAIVVREGDTLLAAAPLALRRTGWSALWGRVAEIVGTGPVPTRGMGLADKAGIPIRIGHPEAAGDLVRGLAALNGRVDALNLKGIDGESRILETMRDSLPGSDRVRLLDRSVSPYLSLHGTWDEYLQRLSGNFRKHLRKYRRNLEKAGDLEIRGLEPGDNIRACLRELIEVNNSSWKGERGTNLFRHPAIRSFMEELIPTMFAQGWIDLRMLRLDGRLVAYELCFDYGGRLFSYNGSYLGEYARFSPGTTLTTDVIASAYERGRTEYDLLRGDESYKERWSESRRTEKQLIAPAATRRSAGLVGSLRLKHWLRSHDRLRELADRITGLRGRVTSRARPGL